MNPTLKKILREGIIKVLIEVGNTSPGRAKINQLMLKRFAQANGEQPSKRSYDNDSERAWRAADVLHKAALKHDIEGENESKLIEADPATHFINQMTGGSDDDEAGRGMRSVQPNTGRTTFADKPVHSTPDKQRFDLAAFRKARQDARAKGLPLGSIPIPIAPLAPPPESQPLIAPIIKDFPKTVQGARDYNAAKKAYDGSQSAIIPTDRQPTVGPPIIASPPFEPPIEEPEIEDPEISTDIEDDELASLAADIGEDPEELKRGASIAAQDTNETLGDEQIKPKPISNKNGVLTFRTPEDEKEYFKAPESPFKKFPLNVREGKQSISWMNEIKPAKPLKRPPEAPAVKLVVKPDKITKVNELGNTERGRIQLHNLADKRFRQAAAIDRNKDNQNRINTFYNKGHDAEKCANDAKPSAAEFPYKEGKTHSKITVPNPNKPQKGRLDTPAPKIDIPKNIYKRKPKHNISWDDED